MTPEMNFAIRYLTRYDYDADVVDNLNALRVKPAANGRQRCDEFGVRLDPEVRLHRHTDYFGTEVVEFEVSRPHRQLTIDVRARVTTKSHTEPPRASWDALREPSYGRPAENSCSRPRTRRDTPCSGSCWR
jgi:transglutaminase-like putative cysteine protease